MKKVSFIIGTHNGSLKLHNLFNSILNQSFNDFEIVVCDDASNDDTFSILNEYYNKYPNIFKIIKNEKSLTLAGALNRCLEIAEGEYIARIDDDDVCYIDRLKIQVQYLIDNPSIDCVGSYMDIFDGENIINTRKIVLNPTINTLTSGGYPFHHPTIMIKKNVLKNLNGYDNSEFCKRCEDLDLWYRFFINGYKGVNINIPLVRYSESLNDYKKRNIQSIKKAVELRKYYRKKLKLNFFNDFIYLKPYLFALLPNWIRFKLKNKGRY